LVIAGYIYNYEQSLHKGYINYGKFDPGIAYLHKLFNVIN
jgi:hypothetical protein